MPEELAARCWAPGEVLELGALWSIEVQELESFERYIAQLKVYYFDYRCVCVRALAA
jgi:hypothetical protein